MFLQLAEYGGLDWDALKNALRPQTKCALIQRSCGYSWRRSLSVNEIGKAIKIIKVDSAKMMERILSFVIEDCSNKFLRV